MLVEITQKRKDYPERILNSQTQESVSESEAFLSHQPYMKKVASTLTQTSWLDENLKELLVQSASSYTSSLEAIHLLKLRIPQLIVKLKDAQQVWMDRPVLDSYESDMKWTDKRNS
jgi:hypothetical protein